MRYRRAALVVALALLIAPSKLLADSLAELDDTAGVDRFEDRDADGEGTDPGFFERDGWDMSLSVGFSGTKGNKRSQNVNTQLRFDREVERHRWLWDNKYFYGRSEGEVDQTEFISRLTKDFLIPDRRWFGFARSIYNYDRFQPFEHRLSGFGGLGYDFIRQDDLAIVGRLGAGVTRDWGIVNDTRPEGLIGLELLRWHITENQNLTASSTLYPNLEDLPRNRVVSAIEWTASVANFDNLQLKLGAEHEYESRTVAGADHHDLLYYGALQYDF